MALADRTHFHDAPTGYKGHAQPTPYLGGVAVLSLRPSRAMAALLFVAFCFVSADMLFAPAPLVHLALIPFVILAILLGVLPQTLLIVWMEPSVTGLVESLARLRP